MLFNLPDDQQISLIEWLNLKDVVFLDSAICNKECRDSFLSLIQLPQCIFPKHDVATSINEARWIVNRSLKFSELTLFSDVILDTQLCDQIIALSGKTMQGLELTSWTCPKNNFEYHNNFLKMKEAVESAGENCSSLQYFAIMCENSHVQLSGALSKTLIRNEHLKTVLLENCDGIDNASLTALLLLPNLWSLLFTRCTFCDSVDLIDGKMPRLQNFTCENVVFTGGSIIDLCKYFSNIVYLSATGVSAAQLESLLSLCPRLEILSVHVTEPIADELAQRMVLAWAELFSLHVHYAEGVTCSEQAMLTFALNLPLLVSLNLVSEVQPPNFVYGEHDAPNCPLDYEGSCLFELYVDSINKGALAQILARSPLLHILAILHHAPYDFEEDDVPDGNTALYPAETALDLVTHSSVKVLHLHNYTHLTAESLGLLGQVEEVFLSRMQGDFIEIDLLDLVTRCPALKVLYLAGCDSISHFTVLSLLEKCPTLRRLRYWNKARKERGYHMPAELQLLQLMVRKLYPELEVFDIYIYQSMLPFVWDE